MAQSPAISSLVLHFPRNVPQTLLGAAEPQGHGTFPPAIVPLLT